jgi:TonB-linked SusC/RagA family outer membrane protein
MNVGFSGRMDKFKRSTGPFIYDYKTFIVNDRGIGPYAIIDDKGNVNPDHKTRIPPEDKNPMALIDPDIAHDLFENSSVNAQMDFTYKVPFVKGLTLNLLGSYDTWTRNRSNRRNAWDMYEYRSDNFISRQGSDSFEKQINLYQKTYGKFQINYANRFGDHSVTGLFAVEGSQDRYDNLGASRQFLDLFTFPTINAGSSTTAQNSGSLEYRRNAAYIGRANYDFKGKYLLEIMARYDGSYRYAPSKRWVLFPSVSAGWRVSEENFFKNNISFINNLKLRGSYGESGRDPNLEAFQYIAAYTSTNGRGYIFQDGVFTAGMYPPGVVNDFLTWSNAKFSNVAVDADLLKSKLSVTLEYYQRKNTGLLASTISSVPTYFGASFPRENLNSDLNRGLEMQLKYRHKIGKDIKFSVGANVTFSRTQRLHEERLPFNSQWDRWINSNENRYTGRNRIYTYDGQYTSLTEYETAPLLGGNMGNARMLPGSYKIIDANGDGRINGDDQLFVNWAYGNQGYVSGEGDNGGGTGQRVNPPLQFGFPIEASYKSFDINILFQGAALYSVNYHMNDIWGYGRYPTLHTKFRDRWHTADPDASPFDPNTVWIPGKYPAGRPYNYDNTTDGMAVDVWRPMAQYLRMKNIELGYSVPRKTLKQIGFENVRIFVNGTNLLLFCNKTIKQTDPERHENDWEAGLSYPIMKQVNFGINLNF